MSVPVGSRGEVLEEVFLRAADLVAMTIHVVRNEKCVPLRYLAQIGQPLIDQAYLIMHKVYSVHASGDKDCIKRYLDEAKQAAVCYQADLHLLFLHFSNRLDLCEKLTDLLKSFTDCFSRWSRKIRSTQGGSKE